MKKMKEPAIGLLLTLPKAFFEDRKMTEERFCAVFERHMRGEDSYWNFRKTQLPTEDVAYVYLVFGGKVQYRCNFMGYQRQEQKWFEDAEDGTMRFFPKTNWILFTGPVVKPPFEISMKGFQGHRYVTKELF